MKDNNFNLKGYKRSRYCSKHCLQNILIRKFIYSGSTALLLDDEPFYHTFIAPLTAVKVKNTANVTFFKTYSNEVFNNQDRRVILPG